jgi:hypothetical protein
MAKVRQLISLSYREQKMLRDISNETGIPISRLLLNGFAYWLKNNPKGLSEEARKFAGFVEERDAKDYERLSGAYEGSYAKEKAKIKRIKQNPKMSDRVKKHFIQKTKAHYKRVRRIHRIRLGISTYKDRLEEFKESHKDVLDKSKPRRNKHG